MLKTAPVHVFPDPPPPPTPLGLIAGGGKLPLMVAQGMVRMGHPVHCVGLRGLYDAEIPRLCASFVPVGPLRLNAWSKALRRAGITHAVMVGRVDKAALAYNWRNIMRNMPDVRTLRLWASMRRDRRTHRLMARVVEELGNDGVQLIDSTAHIPDQMSSLGAMTGLRPGNRQQSDIDLAWPILQEMLRLDIGQAIAVGSGDIIAVEAVEGTDRMIERAGHLCRDGGWTLLKAARWGHDKRADVPTIGPNTIRNLHKAGGRCIAVSAGDVIIIDKPETLALADTLGVAVVGIASR